jgi:hypothetical protein
MVKDFFPIYLGVVTTDPHHREDPHPVHSDQDPLLSNRDNLNLDLNLSQIILDSLHHKRPLEGQLPNLGHNQLQGHKSHKQLFSQTI